MKTHISLNKVFWSFLIIIFLAVSLAFAAPVGKISATQGRVDVLKAGKNVATPVSLGAPVDVGDIYRTKTNSRAEITFINNNTMKIAPATRIEIKEYMVEKERSSTVMKLYRGKVQAVAHQDFVKRAAAFAEGNKFEVHTPNAVAGIRGSDMVVGFTNGTTMIVFISGQGYTYNPGSPQVFVPIVAGQVSFITGEGTPSAPVKASEAIISGEVGAFIQIIEIKGDGKEEEPLINPNPIYVPPDIIPTGGTNFTGTANLFGSEGTLTANIPTTGVGTVSASVAYGEPPTTPLEGFLEGSSDKGGAFMGPVAGVQGSWLNRMSMLYVEGGSIYFLTGDAPGTDDGTTFSMSGTLGKSASGATITLTPGEGQTLLDALLDASQSGVAPQFFPTGTPFIISNSGIEVTPGDFDYSAPFLISNEGKKVAAIGNVYAGAYASTEGTSLPYLGYHGDYEYALGPLFYSHDSTNRHFTIDMLLQSIGIDEDIGPYLGVSIMRYLGTYCPVSDIFRMAGAGTYVATPANFFGDWGGSVGGGSLYYNDSGVMTLAGEDYGYFGGTTAPWTSSASLTAIGQYTLSVTDQPHYLMNSNISGSAYNPIVESPAGTIKGYTGAIWKDGTSTTVGSITDGALRALYISTPDANEYVTAGIMKSSFTGSYYDLSPTKMWGIYGTLTPTQLASGLDPDDLSYGEGSVSSGGLSGDFGGTGGITSSYVTGETKFLYTSEQSLPFGIINIKFAGSSDYRNYYYDKPTGNPSWNATIGSYAKFDSTSYGWGFLIANTSTSGTWTDTGEITGNVTGTAMTPLRLYDVEGKFTGVNSYDYDWIGQVIGSYTGTDLKFFSYFSGDMVDVVDSDGLYFEYMSSLYGHFGGTTSLWSGSNIPVKIIGTVGATCLWYTSNPVYSYNVLTSSRTTYDGGAYYGLAGGSEYDSALAGEFIALYIDNSATPKAGVLKASLSGSIYDVGMFEMNGLVNRTEKSTSIGISASALYGNISEGSMDGTGAYLSGTFNNGAVISGGEDYYYSGATYAIATQPWGIYGLPMLGEFGNLETVPTTWSAKVGSTGTFGAYLDASSNKQPDEGYWLASITGTVPTGATTTEGKLFGTLLGKYLTHTRLGAMDGDVYGTYEDSGYWKAVALGTWTGTDLKFFSEVSQGLWTYTPSGWPETGYDASIYGYLGGTTAPWSGSTAASVIGVYMPGANSLHIGNNDIYSYNALTDQNTTFDSGAYRGFMAGINNDGTLEQKFVTIYRSPGATGTTGFLRGPFTGTIYSSIGMYEMSGTITPTPMGTTSVSADSFYNTIYRWQDAAGYSAYNKDIAATFFSSGTYNSWNASMALPDEHWGVFSQSYGGTYSSPSPTWTAKIGGTSVFGEIDENVNVGYYIASITNGTWAGNRLAGTSSGTYLSYASLGTIAGDFLGTYNSDNTWQGVHVGTWQGTPLQFYSSFHGKMLDAMDSSGNVVFDWLSSMSGNLGGTTSLWSGSNIPVKIIGTVGASCLWYTDSPIYSYNMYATNYTTYDNGAYYGLAGGNEYAFKDIVSTKTLEGKFVALYIDNSATPKAGFLKANLSGDIYKDMATPMFEMDGLVNRTEKSTNIGMSASALYTNISEGSLDGTGAYLSGTFNNGAVISGGEDLAYPGVTYSIATQPWGIYGLPMVGEFGELSTVPTTWSAKVGSTGTFGEYQDASPDVGYWLASITGTVPTGATTTEGKLFGTLLGKYLTHTRLGTMDGDVYGTYEDSGYWKAVALGTWTGTPLKSSLTFSTTDATPTTLWRALPGTYYEGDFVQWDASTNSYYDYKFRYIKTSGTGIGRVKDDYVWYQEKIYFPNGAMFKIDQDGRIWPNSSWDIGGIEYVRTLPSWMDPDNSTFTPTHYSEWPSFLDVLEKRADDYLSAIVGMTGYPWNTGGTPVTIIGQYTADGSDYTKPTIVTTPFLFGTFYTPYVEGGTPYGAYGVTLGGFIADDARGVQIAMRGLYVGPDNQTAGVLRTSQALTGSLYSDIGMWDAEGTLVATVMNSSFASNPEGVTMDNLDEKIVNGAILTGIFGRFTGDSGSLIGEPIANSGTTRNIKGQDWGIFSSTIWAAGFGVTSATLPGTWSAQVGGWGQFGQYKDASSNWQADIGIMLIPTLSGTLTGGVMKASYTSTVGQFMTMTKMGTISDVGVLGVYTQPSPVTPNTLYSWQGVSGGVWNTTQYFTFASSFDASNKRFAEQHSGYYFNGSYNEYYYNYDNEVKWGNISFFSDASRTLITQRKYEPDSGPFSTPMWEEFKYEKETNTFSDYTTGTDYPASFSDAFFSALAISKGSSAPNNTSTWWNFNQDGSISAIMGGVGDLWTATASSPATVYFLGDYDHWYGKPTIFGTEIVSYNVKNDTNTTLDGKGTYYGYIGGREIDGAIDGSIYAVYLDPTTESPAGILKGTFTGTVYSDIEMWAGTGGIYPVKLMDVAVPLASFFDHIYTRDFYDDTGSNTSFTLNGYPMGAGETPSRPFVYEGESITFYATEGSWGVWQSAVGGKYTGITPTDSWNATIEFIDSTRIMGNGVTGTKWSGNKVEGATVGYGADIVPTQTYTWISVGELKGTFNPTLYTFQAGVMGVSVETNTYLTLAATDPGKAKLQALGIPAVQVGMATLTGSGNGFSTLSMNDVKFFATSAGGKPSIWATNSVTGTYTAPPSTSTPISLSGGTLNASFNFKQWNTTGDNAGKWLGSVSGTGGFNGSTTFKGAAAGLGATAGSGSIAGTAAGVAK